ncbi:hypothetical protein ACFXGA_25885 [Actinosynnema sp. NPDC059335]|uniref:hypothetical protein n=1 Tax=Actinosynnema sp. NPDC059335 TaxID=3346804 RepID=UPI00366D253D
MVWLGVGEQVGHLPESAADATGVVAMTTTTPGLAERVVRVARAHRAADPDGFHRRHANPEA